jgi:hypothetical protein
MLNGHSEMGQLEIPRLLLFVLSPLTTTKFLLQHYFHCLAEQVTPMPSIQPLKHGPGSAVDFGVKIDNVDLENLTGRYLTGHY